MRTVKRIEPSAPLPVKRKRVAAYARVSKETERLMHSLSAQVSHYSELIQRNPEWEYAGVYADSGLSGTGTEWRSEYRRLMADCESGKIDIVLVKSISRFARNTVDLLSAVRRLKEIGVSVRFEKEGIDSLSEAGEILLSLLASFAEEEVRALSDNIKWSIRKAYAEGKPRRLSYRAFGYRPENGAFSIVPEEAEIVRHIFTRYIAGAPVKMINRELKANGIKSQLGFELSDFQIGYMLRNELYVGDRMLQKFYVDDPIRKNEKLNRGELPKYYIRDDHPAIISREIFEQAKRERQRRERFHHSAYAFAGRIRCGLCGSPYIRCARHERYADWKCRKKKLESKIKCAGRNIRDDCLKSISADILGLAEFDDNIFAEKVETVIVGHDGSLEFHFCDGRKILWQGA